MHRRQMVLLAALLGPAPLPGTACGAGSTGPRCDAERREPAAGGTDDLFVAGETLTHASDPTPA
ncbi:hypothetical protein ABT154_25770 [Streptomyces sp. NPDC001728]|uniref:hypothetical protein n=1 Tax=Streptomyces sp. NPDC001728 TaxID=3154396 RepID=UPI0033275F57